MKKGFVKAAILMIVALSLLVTACGGSTPAPAPKPAEPKVDPATKTITFAINVDIDTLDPQQMGTEYTPHTLMNAYPVTLGVKRDQPYVQFLKSVELSKDGTTLTMTLPDGFKLNNGKAFTGADWVKALERYKKTSPYASDLDEVKEMKADGQKVILTFKAPTSYFWPVVATAYLSPVDAAEADKLGKEAFGQKPITYGPYNLKEWVRGSQITLTKNPNYVDNTPFVKNHGPWSFDTAIVRIIPDNFTRIKELEAGTVDVSSVPSEFLDQVKNNPKIKLITAANSGEAYIRFNIQKAPFNNLKFRQAVALAISRDEIKTASKGGMEPVYGLLSPSQLCFSAETETQLKDALKQNVEKSKALLAELGYTAKDKDGYLTKGGQRLSLSLVGTQINRVPLTVIQAQLKAVGIEVKIQEQPGGVVNQSVKDRKFDMAIQTWSWPDPDIWFYGLHSSGSTGYVVWSSKETDKLLEDQRKQVDPKERTAIWSQLSTKISQELPVVPLFYYINYTGIRSNIEGYQVAANGNIFWQDAVKK